MLDDCRKRDTGFIAQCNRGQCMGFVVCRAVHRGFMIRRFYVAHDGSGTAEDHTQHISTYIYSPGSDHTLEVTDRMNFAMELWFAWAIYDHTDRSDWERQAKELLCVHLPTCLIGVVGTYIESDVPYGVPNYFGLSQGERFWYNLQKSVETPSSRFKPVPAAESQDLSPRATAQP